jgi:hypothetical protein
MWGRINFACANPKPHQRLCLFREKASVSRQGRSKDWWRLEIDSIHPSYPRW